MVDVISEEKGLQMSAFGDLATTSQELGQFEGFIRRFLVSTASLMNTCISTP